MLSGGGTDGTLGLKAIKEKGGMTLAQGSDGSAPMQSNMPDSAIAAGVVDLVLPVEEMGQWLAQYAANFDRFEVIADNAEEEADEDATANNDVTEPEGNHKPLLEVVYRILLNQVGHDFSGYKERTFIRRVRRRMQVHQLTDLAAYVELLREDTDEVSKLFRDLLIGVTNFFRDPGAFESLEESVMPRLFEGKGASDNVRIWVPGCATGEEVYSLSILVREHLDTMHVKPRVQIFATDIDESALNVARSGRYPMALLKNVSEKRMQRFFSGDAVSQVVNKTIRDLCVFSSHSVIRDPPFSRIDLISCRNLLIYLGTEFQAQVVPIFHFALRPKGYLFLGTSENVSQHTDLFVAVDKKHRIFQRRENARGPLDQVQLFPVRPKMPRTSEIAHGRAATSPNLRRAAENRVLERFAPAHVVVNREGDILHYSPRTGKYLEPAAGLPNRQLLAMARRGLRLELRGALREAIETRRTVRRSNIQVELDDRVQPIDLTVEPFGNDEQDPLFLILFADAGMPQAPSAPPANDGEKSENEKNADRTEQELRDTRERLQVTIEEYETAVEELKASNEELQSMNEELQSTNEELETSKEELQSVNEELQTVNAELNVKLEELDRSNSDLRNLFDSTQIATVFLDANLIVRSFTPAVTSIFNLISSDRGRPLTDIVSHLAEGIDLRRDVQTVIERDVPIDRPVRTTGEKSHYLMRVLPYRRHDNIVDGALITFVDVSNMVRAEEQQRTLIEELNHRVRNMLTVVGALANQTLSGTSSPKEFTAAFLGRIQSLAQAYGLVSRESWNEVSFRELLEIELRAYLDEDNRVTLSGPEIEVKPTQAVALGLVLHELMTNAAKFGALSQPSGQLAVEWHVDGNLKIAWMESGVSGVHGPERRGFGTLLVERQLTESLGGSVRLDYADGGLKAHIEIGRQYFSLAA